MELEEVKEDALEVSIAQVCGKYLNKLITTKVMVSKVGEIGAEIYAKQWKCRKCNCVKETGLNEDRVRCPDCKGNMDLRGELKRDFKEIEIEELLNNLDRQPERTKVKIIGRLLQTKKIEGIQPGDTVDVSGYVCEEKIKQKLDRIILKYYITAETIDKSDYNQEDETLTEDDILAIKEIAKDKPLEKLRDSLAPNIYDYEKIKMALLLQMVRGPTTMPNNRPRIHVLLVGSPSCISGDSYITMADGTFRRIDSLGTKHLQPLNHKVAINRVYSYDNYCASTDTLFIYKNQPTKKIVTETGKEIICSYDHPLYVRQSYKTLGAKHEERYKWVRTDELKVGDKLKVQLTTPNGKKAYTEIECNYLPNKNNKEFVLPKCTEDISYVFGYLLGDGWISGKYKVGAIINPDEIELSKIIQKIIKDKFSLTPRIENRKPSGKIRYLKGKKINATKTVTILDYSSVKFNNVLSFIGKKEIPEYIMGSKKSVVASFLSGLFEADGYAGSYKHNCETNGKIYNHISPKIELKSVYPKIRQQVLLLLTKFGIQARIGEDVVYICRSKDILKFNKYIGFKSKKKLKQLAEAVKCSELKTTQTRKSLKEEKIVSITEAGNRTVYDIHVPEYHNFISNGIVSHNCAKSKLAESVHDKTIKSIYGSGENMSKAGLIATVERDELSGRWGVRAGTICRANKSLIVIDELDKLAKEDRDGLHTPMEMGKVLVDKAGIHAEISADTSILGCCNPKNGKFDLTHMDSIQSQINLPEPLMSRFDLIYIMQDKIEEVRDEKIIRSLMTTGKSRQPISDRMFKKYILYCSKLEPVLTEEVEDLVVKIISDLRQAYLKMDDKEGKTAVTFRQAGALIRLSIAAAKLRLSTKVELEDIKLAEEIMLDALESTGFGRDFNSLEYAALYGGTTKKKLTLLESIKEEIHTYIKNGGEREENIKKILNDKKVPEKDVNKVFYQLRQEGTIIGNSNALKWMN